MRHLHRLGHRIGRHRVALLMRKVGLRAIFQKPNTSAPHPERRAYSYLLQNLSVVPPNQAWCSDITYIPMHHGFLYLVAIMDWYSRRVLSWRLSNTMEIGFFMKALERRRPGMANPRSWTPIRAVSSPARRSQRY